METPVFYDASGKRNKWSLRIVAALLFLSLMAAVGLALTIVMVPRTPAPGVVSERDQPRPLQQQIRSFGRTLTAWLPGTIARPARTQEIVVGFYVPWDPDSRASLARHIGQMDWVVPSLVSITKGGAKVAINSDPAFFQTISSSGRKPRILPMIQNASGDQWDGAGMGAILASPKRRAALVARTDAIVSQMGGSGVVFDFEELPPSAQRNLIRLVSDVRSRFAPKGWVVTLAVPVGDPSWDLRGLSRVADKLFLMNYDEHSPGDAPGPIASQGWFVANLQTALTRVSPGKAIVAVGNYAYDWHDGTTDNMTVEEAWLAANDSDARIQFDKGSGNATFSYDDNGSVHQIWLLDAASAWNQVRATHRMGVSGIALWRLGAEDVGIWDVLRQYRSGKLPDLTRVTPVGNVDVEGNGELLRIEATPTIGARTLNFDREGLIRDVIWQRYPTPFVVQRGGDKPKMVALTFDDGPDPKWTPQILDILEARKVPATFFVVGENAISEPILLNRILSGGSELGNHSYTHPNMAHVSETGINLELNANQRLIEAYTGRSMRLFRAPYFGDAEPTTTDELMPAWIAQRQGYLNVGLHVDPNDWQTPGAEAIVSRVLDQVGKDSPTSSQKIVLLHDGGGERSQTVAALPAIIDGLRARGYRLVPVSALVGVPPATIMPEVTGWDLISVRADISVFLLVAAVLWMLKWLFFVAITLGIARAVLMAGLALRSRYSRDAPIPPTIDIERFVSILIPAFNEEKVIVRAVRRVLASTEVQIEVIVIDDGSSDATSAVVQAAFANDARVRLLTLENGGKARALNRGLALAISDIVIALDADTQFETTTVARLARWFADPEIGAVAGNAKVGNRINLVTRWQAVEYVTAQNLERRALTQFDAITVVPGAVGAWRRAALDAVGGYPVDTLAEDQDLTIAIQRAGWRIGYDIDAVAWTEAPESFRALAKQRFRWAYGTLQCLWKHRAILRERRPAGLALVGIPQAWVFQIGFAMISPIIDLALVISAIETAIRIEQHGWAQTRSDVLTMAVYWLIFTGIDVLCGGVAYWLERREKRYPIHLLVAQRFVYRQVMYWVVLRAIAAALRGPSVGWGKLERSGSVVERVA